MVEIIPYFAALIMSLFGIAFYSAMTAFREFSKEKPDEAPKAPAAEKPV